MAQNILSKALNGPTPEQALRTFLDRATDEEVEQVQQALLDQRELVHASPKPQDLAMVRVCDRWLETVAEYRLRG